MKEQFAADRTPWVICDLDGTLANFDHRLYLCKQEKPKWDAFNAMSIGDSVYPAILALLGAVSKAGWNVAIVTARSIKAEAVTTRWLKQFNVPYQMLLMRNENDNRADAEVKHEMFLTTLRYKSIMFVLEDRDVVVKMWRDQGIQCLQVAEGKY